MKGTVTEMNMIPKSRWVKIKIENLEEMNKRDNLIVKGLEYIKDKGKIPDYSLPNYSEADLIISPEEFQKLDLKLGDEVEVIIKKEVKE
jgi:hypothetical protein